MSLKKRDPSLRVAANDPHLVSLGGGRLSTAVTIHYIPIGDMTIGSLPGCSISLNGSGVLPLHCTLYRSENNEVTIVPEKDARILIDNNQITSEKNLTQGAMITIGNSNYLRFNNPAEAQFIRSTMENNERISMPQIDFEQDSDSTKFLQSTFQNSDMYSSYHEFYETKLSTKSQNSILLEKINKVDHINVNNFHSPKVFAADSVTVNAPAKDVLGPKYASFAKNLAENHKNDKNVCIKNNELNMKFTNYMNIPTSYKHNNSSNSVNNEMLTKVNNNNNTVCNGVNQISSVAAAYERYPKPGSYGGLQLFPMNGLNSEINKNCDNSNVDERSFGATADCRNLNNSSQNNDSQMSPQEQERIDEILKICTEYDRQHQNSITSSPIVQNRIKTNGSLPRENKSPFHFDHHTQSNHNSKVFFPDTAKSSGYENVRLIAERRFEIGNLPKTNDNAIIKSGYENVAAKYIPQSPRTKIRTICMSPKKEVNPTNFINGNNNLIPTNQSNDYAQLIQSFEEKLKLEMNAIQEMGKNTNKLKTTKNSKLNNSVETEKILSQKTEPIDDKTNNLEELMKNREMVLMKIRILKTQIAEVRRQENEVLRELDMEKALVSAELTTVKKELFEMEKNVPTLQTKIARLEAQRNATRIMQESQQAKLKRAIEMKQEQVNRLKKFVENNPSDKPLKEELESCSESLDNDKKTFEDLEFQYLEEETEWLAYREELNNESKQLTNNIEEKHLLVMNLKEQGIDNQNIACNDTKTLETNLYSFLAALEKNRNELREIDRKIYDINGQQNYQSDHSDEEDSFCMSNDGLMSQSLFVPEEIRSSKTNYDLMSRSVNENMFHNNIEIFQPQTSTPKKTCDSNDENGTNENTSETNNQFNDSVEITPEIVFRENNHEDDPILKLKYGIKSKNDSKTNHGNLNLSLGNDDFEVNPLEKRIPSQDDIDRICKITSDAPISTEGASNKIFESIKEIERNRQLLLAQQGSHVIEHERQKMLDIKKKCHDEARAHYLSTQSDHLCNQSKSLDALEDIVDANNTAQNDVNKVENEETLKNQQRYSHPTELETQRPLSETNSELSYDNLLMKPFKSNTDLVSTTTSYRFSGSSEDAKRSSVQSNETAASDKLISGSKRNLQKHQRPLTRYLPISSPDLDLKLHIESSGHQIALCPHVFVDSLSCRGYLHKLGSTFHTWSRRWFVLDRKRKAFIYYADKTEKKPRGGACFLTIEEVYLDHLNSSRSGRPSCTFIVKTKKRSYNLQAASDAAARIWIDAIITGAHGNADYD